MNWSAFKRAIDEKLFEELGAGYDEDSVEIEWIDIGYDGTTDITIHKDENDNVSLQVT